MPNSNPNGNGKKPNKRKNKRDMLSNPKNMKLEEGENPMDAEMEVEPMGDDLEPVNENNDKIFPPNAIDEIDLPVEPEEDIDLPIFKLEENNPLPNVKPEENNPLPNDNAKPKLDNPLPNENNALLNENIKPELDNPLPNENNALPNENIIPELENPLPNENLALPNDNIKPEENGALRNDNIKPQGNYPSEKMDRGSEDSSEAKPSLVEIEEPLNKNYLEFYLNNGYCTINEGRDQYYAKDAYGNEIYFEDPIQDAVYAFKTIKVGDTLQKVEYPATLHTGKPNFIYDHGIPRYPENLSTTSIILPKDSETNQEYYLPNVDGNIDYPRNRFGKAFYRKDSQGNDVPISKHKYATNSDGTEIYPKLSNGDEYYLESEFGNTEIGATMKVNGKLVQYYAREANNDEFYPREYFPRA